MQVRCRNKRLEIPPPLLLIVTPKTLFEGQTHAPRAMHPLPRPASHALFM
jgi:hypothetical protein